MKCGKVIYFDWMYRRMSRRVAKGAMRQKHSEVHDMH